MNKVLKFSATLVFLFTAFLLLYPLPGHFRFNLVALKDSLSPTVSGHFRYKLVVIVQTPEGPKEGNSVREVSLKRKNSLFSSSGKSTKVNIKGEAVVVDLGNRGKLFALMDFDAAHKVVYQTFSLGDPRREALAIKAYEELYEKVGDQRKKLDPSMLYYPILVSFKDLSAPKSVVEVLERDPDDIREQGKIETHKDNFEEIFGEGVSLKGVYIQMTDEVVTEQISSTLPWLNQLEGKYISERSSGSGPELWKRLHEGNFRRFQ